MLILNTLLHEMVMHWFISFCRFQAISVIAAFLMTLLCHAAGGRGGTILRSRRIAELHP